MLPSQTSSWLKDDLLPSFEKCPHMVTYRVQSRYQLGLRAQRVFRRQCYNPQHYNSDIHLLLSLNTNTKAKFTFAAQGKLDTINFKCSLRSLVEGSLSGKLHTVLFVRASSLYLRKWLEAFNSFLSLSDKPLKLSESITWIQSMFTYKANRDLITYQTYH